MFASSSSARSAGNNGKRRIPRARMRSRRRLIRRRAMETGGCLRWNACSYRTSPRRRGVFQGQLSRTNVTTWHLAWQACPSRSRQQADQPFPRACERARRAPRSRAETTSTYTSSKSRRLVWVQVRLTARRIRPPRTRTTPHVTPSLARIGEMPTPAGGVTARVWRRCQFVSGCPPQSDPGWR